jgi:hypothetical protein
MSQHESTRWNPELLPWYDHATVRRELTEGGNQLLDGHRWRSGRGESATFDRGAPRTIATMRRSCSSATLLGATVPDDMEIVRQMLPLIEMNLLGMAYSLRFVPADIGLRSGPYVE